MSESQRESGIDWPPIFERTPPHKRRRCPNGFQVTQSRAFQNILDELARWDGVTDVQLHTDARHTKQNPNKPYANATFDDPSVAVYFVRKGEDMAAACDRWSSPRDNAQDLYHYLHDTRMIEQRGTVTGKSEYDKLRLPAGDDDALVTDVPPEKVLGVDPDAPESVVEAAYRERLKETHPDLGGTDEQVRRVRAAYRRINDGGQ